MARFRRTWIRSIAFAQRAAKALGAGAGVDNYLLEDSCNLLQEDGTSVYVLE